MSKQTDWSAEERKLQSVYGASSQFRRRPRVPRSFKQRRRQQSLTLRGPGVRPVQAGRGGCHSIPQKASQVSASARVASLYHRPDRG